MKLSYVPLLRCQRELYDLPRGRARFDKYRWRVGCENPGVEGCAPWLIVNPMAREAVAARLDEWLALDADGLAARTVAELAAGVAEAPGGSFRVAAVLADDAGGGWTNRYTWEFAQRFTRPPAAQQGWLSAVLWAAETPGQAVVVAAVREVVCRETYVQSRGVARTLRERLAQEGAVLVQAGGKELELPNPEEIEYTREIIRPHLDSTDLPTAIRLIFGDPAAHSLGYEPAGLSLWAGLHLARCEAAKQTVTNGAQMGISQRR